MCGAILIGGMIAVSAYALLQIMAGGGSLAWLCLPSSYVLFLFAVYAVMQRRQKSVVVFRDDPDVIEAEVHEVNEPQYTDQMRFMHMYFLHRLWKFQMLLLKIMAVLAVIWFILQIILLYMRYYY